MSRTSGWRPALALSALILQTVAAAQVCEHDGAAIARIVDGREVVNRERYPFMTSVQVGGQHYCGGTLVGEQWILTAAHCAFAGRGPARPCGTRLRRRQPDELEVVWGDPDLLSGTRHRVAAIVVHPGYDDSLCTSPSDIALLQLEAPIPTERRQRASPAGPALERLVMTTGQCATVVGWGSTEARPVEGPGSDRPGYAVDRLQTVSVPLLAAEQCSYERFNGSTMLCAGFPEGGRDSCQGDSGGPLMVPSGIPMQPWVQVGVVSYGQGCAAAGFPGVYTRVAAFRPWLDCVIQDGSETACPH